MSNSQRAIAAMKAQMQGDPRLHPPPWKVLAAECLRRRDELYRNEVRFVAGLAQGYSLGHWHRPSARQALWLNDIANRLGISARVAIDPIKFAAVMAEDEAAGDD